MLLDLVRAWLWRRDVKRMLRTRGWKWFRFVDYQPDVGVFRVVGVALYTSTGMRLGEMNAIYCPGDYVSLEAARRRTLSQVIGICCVDPPPT